ncbi:MAG TPA: hypothetical protein VFG56_00680 [Candidatus Saccharimonadales bacterium]|nr:hypothetical protein [Candidatus Saccharimonadales bacterium]
MNQPAPRIYAVIHHGDRIFLPESGMPSCQAELGMTYERQIGSHILQSYRLGVSNQCSLGYYDDSLGYLMRLSHGALMPEGDDWLSGQTAAEYLMAGKDVAAAYFAKQALGRFSASRRLDIVG